jgi:hypothetical protein
MLGGEGEVGRGRSGGALCGLQGVFRQCGEPVLLPGQVVATAEEEAGLVLVHRLVALLRDGGLVNRASFFRMLEARRSQEKGLAVCAAAHEDLLILRKRGGEG